MTAQDLITNALYELNVLPAGQVAPANDLAYGLARLNLILDQYNTQPGLKFGSDGAANTNVAPMTPLLTVGPGQVAPNIATTTVPGKILRATISYPPSAANQTVSQLKIIDPYELRDILSVTNLPGIPTYLAIAYEANVISVSFYPIPSIPISLELLWERYLPNPVALADTLTLPPGYNKLLFCQLVIEIANAYESQPSAVIVAAYRDALQSVKYQNARPSRSLPDSRAPGYGGYVDDYRQGRY